MHVAFVLAALQAGGAEKVIAGLARAAVDRGWQATVITFDAPGDPVFHPIDPRVELIRLGVPPRGGGLAGIGATAARIRALRRQFRAGRYSVAVSFLTKINAISLLASIGLGLPVIVSERNNPEQQLAHPAWRRAMALLYRRAAAIVMQTAASCRSLPTACRGSATVIPNPVAAPKVARPADPPRTIAAVGRLTDQKGFDLLIEAFATLAPAFPDWRLIIRGEGEARGRLQAQINGLMLEDRIALPGVTTRPGEWIAQTGIFVLSSRFEGFPNVLGEAMAAGLPVVAFDCDFGPRELVEDGHNGLLVPSGDSLELAMALKWMMTNRGGARRLADAAPESVARLGESFIHRDWFDLIERVARPAPLVG